MKTEYVPANSSSFRRALSVYAAGGALGPGLHVISTPSVNGRRLCRGIALAQLVARRKGITLWFDFKMREGLASLLTKAGVDLGSVVCYAPGIKASAEVVSNAAAVFVGLSVPETHHGAARTIII